MPAVRTLTLVGLPRFHERLRSLGLATLNEDAEHYGYGLALGGPAAVGIGWPVVSLFTLAVAAGMAELASVWPTAGGLYYWAVVLRDHRWGWWVAWLNLGGLVSALAGIDYAAAGFLCVTILRPAETTAVAGLR